MKRQTKNERTVGFNRIIDQLRNIKWGGGSIPWGTPITYWTDDENARLTQEVIRRSKAA